MSQTRNLGGGGRSAVVVPPDVPSRLLLGAQCSLPLLGDEANAKLAPLLSYESVVVVAGSVLALLAASTMGLGLAVDVILGVAAVAVIGSEAIEACRRLGAFYELCVDAKYPQDFEAAGKEFATFVIIVGVNVVLALLVRGRAVKAPTVKILDSGALRAGWFSYVERLTFRVPRDKGVLWSQLGARHAERLARSKGLTSLEMLLKREGFLELYARQFGTFKKPTAAGLEGVTLEIWQRVSRRYAASLEGRVSAFVSHPQLAAKVAGGREPILVDELWEIAEAMRANPKISSVQMIDVSTGQSWLMLRSQILKGVGPMH